MNTLQKIGLGGGCHWCTEAVFQSLKAVVSVEQGYLASSHKYSSFSEGVIVTYNTSLISLQLLIRIHLLTHKSASNHSMRDKYRSAIYTFSETQKTEVNKVFNHLQEESLETFITMILDFEDFKSSTENFTNYYYNNPEKPFCETFINPKLKLLLENFSDIIDEDKLHHLNVKVDI